MATKFASATFVRSATPRSSGDGTNAVRIAKAKVGSAMDTVISDARALGKLQQSALDSISDQALKRSITGRTAK